MKKIVKFIKNYVLDLTNVPFVVFTFSVVFFTTITINTLESGDLILSLFVGSLSLLSAFCYTAIVLPETIKFWVSGYKYIFNEKN